MPPKTVQTVLGQVKVSDLGIVMTHEHLSMDYSCIYIPPSPEESQWSTCPFTLPNLHWIHRNPFSHKYNLILNDEDTHSAVREEMKLFKEVGGGTIVENTTTGLRRNLPFYKQLAQENDINIIAGAGYYIGKAQTDSTKQMSTEELCDVLRTELLVGGDGTDIRCGFIGEIASVYPIEPFERRVLVAAATVQRELGCGVMIHPHRIAEAPMETLRIFMEAGGDRFKVAMAHLDHDELLEFGMMGTFLEFDMFGIECSHYQLNKGVDMPNDGQRIASLRSLVEHGLADKIIVAHDIYAKHRLMKFGGHGYSHLIRNLRPKMLQRKISQENVDKFFIHNPARWLGVDKQ